MSEPKPKRRQTRKQPRRTPLLRQVWCVWLGGIPLTENRRARLKEMREMLGVPVILITDETLENYIKPESPIHPAYQYLSNTHKSDYMRTYMMHHYGGGYSDIKRPGGNWVHAFDTMERNPNIWVAGYQEFSEIHACTTDLTYERAAEVKANWRRLVGNGSYICRPNTPITREWFQQQKEKLDNLLEPLRQNPAQHPRDGEENRLINGEPTKYPVGWVQILGSIFHDVCLKYIDHVRQLLNPPYCREYI